MFKQQKTYADGLLEGQALARAEFERVLCILREELADARRDRDGQLMRADGACDLLLQHLGARAISLAGVRQEHERVERNTRAVHQLADVLDPTDELPYDHPNALYKNARDASLFASGEDVQQ